MKFLLFFAIVACALTHTAGRTLLEDKIVGGIIASRGQFPYHVYMTVNGEYHCGGSVIDQNTILTAAHCVYGQDRRRIKIVAGTNKLNQDGVSYSVSRYEMHENYSPYTTVNDIAVIKVTTPIEFTKYIQPIDIDSSIIPSDNQCVVTGWGRTRINGNPSNDLLYIRENVIDFNSCKRAFSNTRSVVLNSNVCTFSRYGMGTCNGDSGGPLVCNNKQIGIVSWGKPCAKGVPDVYTKVSYYYNWIKKQQAQEN